jgi:hypothetical protein
MTRRLIVLLSCTIFAVACGSGEDPLRLTPAPLPTAAPDATGLPAGDASITITSPDDGTTFDGELPKVSVKVEGFELANKMGEAPKRGEGHIIYYGWNGFGPSDYEVPTALGQPANAGGTGYIAAASHETTYEWLPAFIRPGQQSLVVQLVNNDHTPLDPPVTARVSVTISNPPTPMPPTPTPADGGDPAA